MNKILQVLGIYPALDLLKGELFPNEIRATAGSIVVVVGKFTQVASYKFFPTAIASFGFHYVVYFFALMFALMVIWGLLTIKDIDQLSLTEIQDMGRNAKQDVEGMEETKEVWMKEITQL